MKIPPENSVNPSHEITIVMMVYQAMYCLVVSPKRFPMYSGSVVTFAPRYLGANTKASKKINGNAYQEKFPATIPLSKPIIVITLLNSFMAPWIDYIFAKVILGQDRQYYTIAIGLWTMLEKEFVEYYYTQFFAGCVIISIPISIIFLISQRFYVEGISGAVKG